MTSSVRARTLEIVHDLANVARDAEAKNWRKLAAALHATCASAEDRLTTSQITVVVAGGAAKRALLNELAGETLFAPAGVEVADCLVLLRRTARFGYVARLADGRSEDFARTSPDRGAQLAEALAGATRELEELDQRIASLRVEHEEKDLVVSQRTAKPPIRRGLLAILSTWLTSLFAFFRPQRRLKPPAGPRVISAMIARRDVERSIEEAERAREKAQAAAQRIREETATHEAERCRKFVAAVQALTDGAARGRDVVELALEVPFGLLPSDVIVVDAPAAVSSPNAKSTLDGQIRQSHLRELRDRAGACILVAAPGSIAIGDLEDSLRPIVPHVIEAGERMGEAIPAVFDRARAEAPLSVLALALADMPARLEALAGAAAAGEAECRSRIAALERDRIPEPEKFRQDQLERLAGAIDEGAQRVLRHASERLRVRLAEIEREWTGAVDACSDRRAVGQCAERIEAAAPKQIGELLDALGDDIGTEMQNTSEALQIGVMEEVRKQYRSRYKHADKTSAVIAELPADETASLQALPLTRVFFGFHRERAVIWLGALAAGGAIGAAADAALGALIGASTGVIVGTIAALLPATRALKARCNAAIRAHTAEVERVVRTGLERSCSTFARDIRVAVDDSIAGALAQRSRSIIRLIELEGSAIDREKRMLTEIHALRDALEKHRVELEALAGRAASELRDYVARTR